MRAVRRTYLVALLLATPAAALAQFSPARETPLQQFFARMLGDWVGTSVATIDSSPPETSYFHLAVTRVDDRTFCEEYTYYRIHPQTGVLEQSGTQVATSTIEADGTVRRTCRGRGTILIDFKPRNQAYEANGTVRCAVGDRIEASVTGRIAVDGMPLKLGKKGRIQKATASCSLESGKLVGQSQIEIGFRALFLARRFRIKTDLCAERGVDVAAVARRAPVLEFSIGTASLDRTSAN